MMHSAYNRLNSIFTFALCALVAAAFLSQLAGFTLKQEPNITLKLDSLRYLVKAPARYYLLPAGDSADFTFDLLADLRTIWNWNTKQLFVYVAAEYKNALNDLNEVVIWDSIIQQKEDAFLNLTRHVTEYGLQDHGFNLRGTEVTLTFTYHEMPITGFLLRNNQLPLIGSYIQKTNVYRSPPFLMPSTYTNVRSK
eukprot:TRINITY_DN1025_c0_g1_i9.p1 TRINITY_DN1025_c0_g1~~TRINITY_DN1025_c0_g1_i9.p1  ORF type:complete len:195 (-),score=14.92 TRINITY_DN1025_c0_g1_i9:43-627(-)